MNITSRVAKRQAAICLALIEEIDQAVVNSRQPADQVLARIYRQHREYGARDRRFFSNAVFSWFRWRGWLKTPANVNIAAAILLDTAEIPPQLEYIIEGTGLPHEKIKPPGPLTLEQKAEYLQKLLKMYSLWIDESGSKVRQPKTVAGLAEAGPGATLRPCSGQAPPATILSAEGGSVSGGKFSYLELAPDWVADALFIPANCKPEDHLRQCIESFQTRPPTWLRLCANRKNQALQLLAQLQIATETHSLIKAAVFVKGPKNPDLFQLPGVEAQDLASQCVGICCNPKPGEKWWDVCAGSGGKSLHLADLMRDNGFILATDIRPAILKQLSGRLERNKCRSIKISLWDGAADLPAVAALQALQAGPDPEVYFEGVLVDAPCSGLGTWARNPDARWRTSAGQIRDYANIQRNLLQIAAKRVASGGRLVYSTCTLTKAENTEVVSHFLAAHSEFQLEQIINPLDNRSANGLIWIWPWEGNCNGMFIAVMMKG